MAARLGRSRPASAYIKHVRRYVELPTSGPLASTLPSATSALTGEQEFAGPIVSTLKPIVSALAGSAATAGSVASTLQPVGSGLVGAVVPTGPFSFTLMSLTSSFGSETTQFGERVIHVEAQKRGLLVTDDSLTPVYITDIEET